MHKKLILVVLVFLLIGCKKLEDSNNYIEFVDNCLGSHNVTNEVALGYKYYMPRGVKKERDYDYNQVFIAQGEYIYLYVDVISYFYKKDIQLKDSNSFYYNPIIYNNKKGYIKIDEVDNKYFVNIVYNYSKIEFFVKKEKLTTMITLSSIILNSIEYNDVVIEKVLQGDLGKFSEFNYELEKPDNASSNFSQYLEEYVQKEDEKDETETEKLPDE